MTVVAWKECRNGHPLTDPANIYITPSGDRRCRECKRESNRRTRPKGRPVNGTAKRYPNRATVSARKYREWARAVWREMSEDDRVIVSFALGYSSIEELVS